MRRKSQSRKRVLLAPLLLVVLGASAGTPPAGHPTVRRDLEPLRSEFNREAGRVQLLLLVDPT